MKVIMGFIIIMISFNAIGQKEKADTIDASKWPNKPEWTLQTKTNIKMESIEQLKEDYQMLKACLLNAETGFSRNNLHWVKHWLLEVRKYNKRCLKMLNSEPEAQECDATKAK